MSELADAVREVREAKAEADAALAYYKDLSLPTCPSPDERRQYNDNFRERFAAAELTKEHYERLLKAAADALLDAAEERDRLREALRKIDKVEASIMFERCHDCDSAVACSAKKACCDIERMGGSEVQKIARAALRLAPTKGGPHV